MSKLTDEVDKILKQNRKYYTLHFYMEGGVIIKEVDLEKTKEEEDEWEYVFHNEVDLEIMMENRCGGRDWKIGFNKF